MVLDEIGDFAAFFRPRPGIHCSLIKGAQEKQLRSVTGSVYKFARMSFRIHDIRVLLIRPEFV
jgi:hypothetical protein